MNMKSMRKISLAVISISTAAIAFTSCEQDEIKNLDSRLVSLQISMEKGVDTKAATSETFETVDLSDNGISLYLNATKTLNTEDPFTMTRAEEITSVSEFPIIMTEPSNNVYASGNARPTSATYWSIFNGGDKVVWPAAAESGTAYNFFAYVDPANAASLSREKNYAMDYAGITPSTNDATAMKDFLMAYTGSVQHDHEKQNLVKIHFYHPLAGIKFNFDLDEGVVVKKVAINNVYNNGTAVYQTSGTDFKTAIKWESLSNKVTYSQADLTTEANRTFYIIPQAVKGNNEVTFTFTIDKNGVEYSFTTRALGVDEWTPGYVYNYSLSSTPNGTVGIEVKEEFNGTKKENVRVANVKTSAVYIRAAVVANWYNSANKVAAPFTGDCSELN